jgi:hypothetical protein
MAMTHSLETEYKQWRPERVDLIGDRAVRFRDVCVHEIRIGDVEDSEIYVAGPMFDWEKSDAGKWIWENAVDKPYWICQTDVHSYGYLYHGTAQRAKRNLF